MISWPASGRVRRGMVLDLLKPATVDEYVELFEAKPAHTVALKVAEAYSIAPRNVPLHDPLDHTPRGLVKRALVHPFMMAAGVGMAALILLMVKSPTSGIEAFTLAMTFAGPMAMLGFGLSVVTMTHVEQRLFYTHVAYSRGLRDAIAKTRPPLAVRRKAHHLLRAIRPGHDPYRVLKGAWPQPIRVNVEPLAKPFIPPKPTTGKVVVEKLSGVFQKPQDGQPSVSYPWIRLTRGERSLAFAHAGDTLRGFDGQYHLVAPCCGPNVELTLPPAGPTCGCGAIVPLPTAVVQGTGTLEAILGAYLGTDPLETIILASQVEDLIPLRPRRAHRS